MLNFNTEAEVRDTANQLHPIRAAIWALELSQKWSIQGVVMSEDNLCIAQAPLEGEAIAVSDRSFKEMFGTATWTICGE